MRFAIDDGVVDEVELDLHYRADDRAGALATLARTFGPAKEREPRIFVFAAGQHRVSAVDAPDYGPRFALSISRRE